MLKNYPNPMVYKQIRFKTVILGQTQVIHCWFYMVTSPLYPYFIIFFYIFLLQPHIFHRFVKIKPTCASLKSSLDPREEIRG